MTAQAEKQAVRTIAGMLAELHAAAQAAAGAESAFKREIDRRIADLEQARAFAHRRLDIIKTLCAVTPEGTSEACAQARLKALFRHIGWIDDSIDELDATEREVRDALAPVAAAVEELMRFAQEQAQTPAQPSPQPSPPISPILAFGVFEAWYRQRFSCEFLGVFEERASFRPLVDF